MLRQMTLHIDTLMPPLLIFSSADIFAIVDTPLSVFAIFRAAAISHFCAGRRLFAIAADFRRQRRQPRYFAAADILIFAESLIIDLKPFRY